MSYKSINMTSPPKIIAEVPVTFGEMIEVLHVAIASFRLYLQGVIKEKESIIYMIQKNRLKKNKKMANSKQQVAA